MTEPEVEYDVWYERVLEEASRVLLCPATYLRASDDVNLFDLGFNSLLLVRMQVQLRGCGAAQLTMGEMMERSTLASLAEFLAERYG